MDAVADHHARDRSRMADLLVDRGIGDERVLEAMRSVPRHEFTPPGTDAYADHPIGIGYGATISQPYIVAVMADALDLQPTDNVLEVGTGSGYGAAVLARLAGRVTTIESVPQLAASAGERLSRLAPQVDVVCGDGSVGHPDAAPYDAICVTAAAPTVPPPLMDQLSNGGRLVLPVRRNRHEMLVRVTRRGDRFDREDLLAVRFVPLVGEHGW